MSTTATVAAGYKQTDIGVLPEEWEVKQLGELFDISSSKRVFQSQWKSNGVPFYRARELAVLGERGSVNNELFITQDLYDSFKKIYGVPKIGDMLVTGVGTLGKVYVVCNNQKFYFKDGNIIWFKIEGAVDSQYLRQLYLTPLVQRQIGEGSAGTTVGTYTITGAKKTVIPCPSKPEQQAISKALSDVDKMIRAIDDLITKKKALKQAAMQELLTGKRWLAGFNSAWIESELKEVCLIQKGSQLNRATLSASGEFPVINGGIDPSGYTDQWNVNGNTITISEGGNSCGYVNYIKCNFWAGGHCYYLSQITQNIHDLFLFYILKNLELKIMQFRVGSGLPNIQKKNLNKLVINLPSNFEEQREIALIVDAMTQEIQLLEVRLGKLKMIKTGMMQSLLTGKIRLLK